jgi:hypothetical protein
MPYWPFRAAAIGLHLVSWLDMSIYVSLQRLLYHCIAALLQLASQPARPLISQLLLPKIPMTLFCHTLAALTPPEWHGCEHQVGQRDAAHGPRALERWDRARSRVRARALTIEIKKL